MVVFVRVVEYANSEIPNSVCEYTPFRLSNGGAVGLIERDDNSINQ